MMLHFHFNGESYNPESVEALHGFIYKITYEHNKEFYYYYGKKNFHSTFKKKLGKKELALITDKRLKTYKQIKKENNWRDYLGSCKDERIKEMILIDKEILKIIPNSQNSSINLTYWEMYYIITNDAIIDEYCLNANILNKFHRGRIV
jgi:hypothetical protein